MHPIQLQIYKFLETIQSEPYKIPEDLLNKFGAETRKELKRQFEREPKTFRLSMSNAGKPICQLQYEQAGVKGEDNTNIIRNLYGDIVEDIVLFLLHASGINVVSEAGKVIFNIASDDSTDDYEMRGEYDVILDLGDGPKVWDIKSASDWAFRNKFTDVSFEEFYKNDTFGYVAQLFLYSAGLGIPVGGIIVCDKSSGQIGVVAFPEHGQEELQRSVIRSVYTSIKILSTSSRSINGLQIQRAYKEVAELFRGKPTGNTTIMAVCELCKYKWQCWPTLILKPQAKSKAKNPKLVYYTKYIEENAN